MTRMKLKYMHTNILANNDSEKLRTKKKTTTSGKLIIAVYALYVSVCTSRTYQSGRLEYNSLSVGLVGWRVSGNVRRIWQEVGG